MDHGCVALVMLAAGSLSCGSADREDNELPTSWTGISTSSASGTGDTTSSEGADETGVKLDVGMGGDAGNGGDGMAPNTCVEAAMLDSNQGCEFWAVDLPNAWAGSSGSPAPQDQQFAVVVANTSSDVPANVEVFVADSATAVDSFSVPTGQIHEFRLSPLNQDARANTYAGQAYRVESDVPITAYQFNPLDNTVQVFSNDASLLFPTHVLGSDYTAVTGDSILLGTDQDPAGANSGAFVSIVATEDATTVDLFASWGLYPGGSSAVMLDRGQVFTAVSLGPNTFPGTTGDGNLSGSRVVADLPVAVFSGNVATIEPNPGQCCADHLEQQMLPLVAWGSGYAAAPPPAPAGGASDPAGYRITGSFDGTSLSYSPSAPPGAPATINAGQTVRFQTNQAFTVTSTSEDRPFAITQFLLSNQAISGGFSRPGDPAMISLPAVAQFQVNYIFLVPDGYATNYVTVVREAGTEVSRDGVSVAAAAWQSLGTLDGVSYEFVSLSVPTGSHSIESEQPCGIISVGYDADVSYGYPGGSGLKIISEPPPPPAG